MKNFSINGNVTTKNFVISRSLYLFCVLYSPRCVYFYSSRQQK